jgi:transcriptional regulator with XRE-family HTH domain
MIQMTIADNLKAIRKDRGFTQAQLSDLAQIDVIQLSRIERGKSQPGLESLKKIAIALGCSTDELVFDKDERELTEDLGKMLTLIKRLPDQKQDMIKEFILTVVQRHESKVLLDTEKE